MSEQQKEQLTLAPAQRIKGTPRMFTVEELTAGKHGRAVGPEPSPDFLASVRAMGIVTPITVAKSPRGRLIVRAGRVRLRAAQEVGLDEIPGYEIEVGGWSHDNLVTAVENEQRREPAAATLPLLVDLIDNGRSEEEVYEATGIPASRQRAVLKLRELRPELLAGLDDSKMDLRVANAAAKFDADRQQKCVERLKRNGKLTWVDIVEIGAPDEPEGAEPQETIDVGWRTEVSELLISAREKCPHDLAGEAVRESVQQTLFLLDKLAPEMAKS